MLRDSAIQHLGIIRSRNLDPARVIEECTRAERRIIPLAFTYGLEVDEIVSESGLPIERVQELLRGA